jgi:hypothetical protein
MEITLPEIRELGGTLRRGSDGWYWCDDRFEPRVRDLLLEELAPDWRCVRRGRYAWVEIPTDWRFTIHDDELERAVTELVRDYATIGSIRDESAARNVGERGQLRSGYRVPIEAWQLIMRQPIGATWSVSDDTAIRARARALGYAGDA